MLVHGVNVSASLRDRGVLGSVAHLVLAAAVLDFYYDDDDNDNNNAARTEGRLVQGLS